MTALTMAIKQHSVLVINPNTTKAMTDALVPLIAGLGLANTRFEYFTAPSGVPSINNEDDAAFSAEHCLPSVQSSLPDFDAVLVCCYSQHPLVTQIRTKIIDMGPAGIPKLVTGIFEASVATSLQTIDVHEKFGIVSTGQQWVEILNSAVAQLLGSASSTRYAGTETTGLNADELHTAPPDEVNARMKAATKCLLARDAKAICLGCAGMAGMDRTVRDACVEALGEIEGRRIRIVDGVLAGALFLDGALKALS